MSKAKNPSIAVLKRNNGAERIGKGPETVAAVLDRSSRFEAVRLWADGETFAIGEVVEDPSNAGTFYRCARAHTVTIDDFAAWRDTQPTYWEPVDQNNAYMASVRTAKHITAQRSNMSRAFNGIGQDFVPDSRAVIMMGDSHSWGQGSDSYEGGYDGDTSTVHSPYITSAGYFAKLKRHIMEKLGTSHRRAVPFYGDNLVVKEGSPDQKTEFDPVTGLQTLRITKGKYRRWQSLTPADKNRSLFGGARLRQDTYSKNTYRYLPEIGAFDSAVIQFGPDITGGGSEAQVIIDVPEPINVFNLGLVHYRADGAKLKVEILTSTMPDDYDISGGSIDDPFFQALELVPFRPGDQGVIFNPERTLTNNAAAAMYTINAATRSIEIDTSVTDDAGTASQFYPHVIKTYRKFTGKIRISWVADGVNYTTAGLWGGSQSYIRGVLLGNNDQVANWSLGGHTTGAMVGTEASYWNETRNHFNDINKYTFSDPTLFVFQLPFVNEIVANTTTADFKTNLGLVLDSMPAKNIILFTTLGAQDKEYPASGNTALIKMAEYTKAALELCAARGNVQLIDVRTHLRNLVNEGELNQDDLYYDNGHPSPRVNQIVYEYIRSAVDYAL